MIFSFSITLYASLTWWKLMSHGKAMKLIFKLWKTLVVGSVPRTLLIFSSYILPVKLHS